MFLASALDVISVVIGVLKDQSLSLIQSSNLLAVMVASMDDNDEVVRQSAFGVLGDIAQYCFVAIQDHLAQFTQLCVKHMNIEYAIIHHSSIHPFIHSSFIIYHPFILHHSQIFQYL